MDIREQLQIWLKQSEELLAYNYNKSGLRSSGNFENSIDSTIIENNDKLTGIIYGASYVHQMVNGRKPGKFPPLDAIRNWVRQKGIVSEKISENSLVYLISRKIAKEGIKVPNFYNDGNLLTQTFTDERINELYKLVGKTILVNLKDDLSEKIKVNK
jgi:hypothetical protein